MLKRKPSKSPRSPPESKSDSGSEPNSWASEGIPILKIRSKVQQNVHQAILRLEGVNDRSGAQYYFGKRVAYIYKTKSGQKDKRFRVINN